MIMSHTKLSQPHVIMPTAVYTVEEALATLKLRQSTIRREVRARRLRISKRAGRYYLLGEWILEWLRAGEVQRKLRPDQQTDAVT
jgi:hypothetical protein